MTQEPLFPIGHFYSPITDADSLRANAGRIWDHASTSLGIDYNDAQHIQVLQEWFPRYMTGWNYPVDGDAHSPSGYFLNNDQFSHVDARALFVLLQALKPKRVLEVGSGYSSLLTADVNHRFMQSQIDFTCIEPYPRDFLRRGFPGLTRLLQCKVEDLPMQTFAELQSGDILFIDSSHVSKTGSDVNFLFFDILPRLRSGVLVHVHDIFLPHEYPREWAIEQCRSWNEQYLLRALLMFSTRFRPFFGALYARLMHPTLLAQALAQPEPPAIAGGSFWIQVL
jgi:predicted O-methyltransferase YrrM